MARIKATTLTVEYQTVRLAQAQANEKNDCTVKAVALLTGATYATAHAAMARFGRQPGKGASNFSTERAIMALGFRLTPVETRTMIQRYPKGHSDVLKSVTSHHPRRFPKAWTDGNAYLAFTAGHALAIVNGVCHDWSANKALRIYRLLKVEPNTVGRHYNPFAEPHASVDRATALERAKPVIATTEKFGVWCTVSGGVTGFREGWFKANGEVKAFATMEEANDVAVRLNAGMGSPYSTAKFHYEAMRIVNGGAH